MIQEWNFKNDKLEGAGKVTTWSWKVYEWNFKNGDLEGEVEITYSDWMVWYIYLK